MLSLNPPLHRRPHLNYPYHPSEGCHHHPSFAFLCPYTPCRHPYPPNHYRRPWQKRHIDAATRIIHSPDRQRKQRTPDGDISEPSRSHLFGCHLGFCSDLLPETSHASALSSHPACGEANVLAISSRGGGGKGGIITRRREANRLTAQRFRNRKKGYQNSLEERIRILEHEKDLIAKALNQSHQRLEPDNVCYRQTEAFYPHSLDLSDDGDVRYASLESVNRSPKSDWRGVMVVNARLKDEVERWRTWERAQRDSRPASVLAAITTYHGPALAPSYPSPIAPPSFTSAFYSSMYPPWHSPPPPERGHSNSKRYCYPPSPCQRLPPIATRIPSAGRLRTPPFPERLKIPPSPSPIERT